jgi:hypothetical protein
MADSGLQTGLPIPAILPLALAAPSLIWLSERLIRQLSTRFTPAGVSTRFWLKATTLPWASIRSMTIRRHRFGVRVELQAPAGRLSINSAYYSDELAFVRFIECSVAVGYAKQQGSADSSRISNGNLSGAA